MASGRDSTRASGRADRKRAIATSAAGWYFDGGPRLNTPIKPALWLGAKRVIVID
jgi:hypothetical protein